jgi:nucleotide-binding universal stress UspA family protein
MESFKHILFPIDLSPRSEAARPVVEAWARRFNAKVTLLHTIQIPISSYGGADGYPIVVDIPGIEATAKARLERVAMDAPGVTRVSIMGDPAYEIAQYAEKNDVDLIMMPTHGYGPFRSLLLGSTAAKVLHDAHCPVWTSAHIEELPVEARTETHQILCAIEADAEAVELIRTASELAQAWQAKLSLVHAVPVDEVRPEKYLEGDLTAALIKQAREQIAGLQREAGTSVEVTVEGGKVAHVVRDAALALKADLVVAGRGKAQAAFGRLRSNTYAIVRDSLAPVLSV